jgi:hypothetical protein
MIPYELNELIFFRDICVCFARGYEFNGFLASAGPRREKESQLLCALARGTFMKTTTQNAGPLKEAQLKTEIDKRFLQWAPTWKLDAMAMSLESPAIFRELADRTAAWKSGFEFASQIEALQAALREKEDFISYLQTEIEMLEDELEAKQGSNGLCPSVAPPERQ